MLEGNPILQLDNRAWRLEPGACGLLPIGMKQAWLGPESGTAKWIDMNTPVAKGVNFAEDTYFLGAPPDVPVEPLDIRDPTSRHLFRMADDDIKGIDILRTIRSFDPCMPCTTHMDTGRGVITREVNSCGCTLE